MMRNSDWLRTVARTVGRTAARTVARTVATRARRVPVPPRARLAGLGCAGLLAVLVASGCGPGNLAEAAGHRLTVDDAARLIAEHSALPADTQVVRVVAELWVDYSLLSTHLAADSMLGELDVGPIVEQPLEEILLDGLRDAVIDVDTVVTDEELTERFAADLPGARATASQILLLLPPGATIRQQDSVLTLARSLRDQLVGGGDFATLAGRYSGDPGSGSRGGSMGTFGRGEMLAPIDSAVFAMQPGQLSAPVETRLGYHLLRLDALAVPELSEVGAEFRAQIQQERLTRAEGMYIARIDSAAQLAFAPDALELARALIESLPPRLSRSAAERPLMTWSDGGVYTTGQFLELARTSPEGFAEGLAAAPDAELRALLRRLAQQELLLSDAREAGFDATAAQVDSVSSEARTAIRDRAAAIGLIRRWEADGGGGADGVDGADSVGGADAVDGPDSAAPTVPTVQDLVRGALARIVSGQQEILPLGAVTFLLRETGAWRIHESRIGATLERAREVEVR